MSKNFNFNKTEFKGNNMKKESYEGSRLGSARSGSAAELSQLLAGGRKTENLPTRRHTLQQRLGVQSDKASSENLQITSHPPSYKFYSMSETLYSTTAKSNSDGKWPESASKTHCLTRIFTASIRRPPSPLSSHNLGSR
ncbi:hypothetical protein L3X38_031811 [Prunus dulcis]|uniref:Uncharacterized protein n=1 Tax=Prunus dulcis TaxID=3755 RepID=A0AAD4VCT7_PRUDU|nr:hypothetical protein L3X38_031811 [Prunus dulcis]